MSKRKSAGILLYRKGFGETEVLLIMHGGPFWIGKNAGAWSIPKGEFTEPETPLQAAIREFQEETGLLLQGDFMELQPVVQKGGKQVFAFAVQGDIDADTITSNMFSMEWPPKSGNWQEFPEVAKASWYPVSVARSKINTAQVAFLEELLARTTGVDS
jgi:predicted NUDIX family NTP pyrophosphohydrolase